MATASRIESGLHVAGHLSSTTMKIPDATLTDAGVNGSAKIAASKLVHRPVENYQQAPGSDVVAATVPLFIAHKAGSVIAIEVAGLSIPSGDKTVTVDLQKSTGGGAFATILTGVVTIDSGETARVAVAGTINTAAFVDGDVFQLVVAVTGSSGTQVQGLVVTVTFDQDPS